MLFCKYQHVTEPLVYSDIRLYQAQLQRRTLKGNANACAFCKRVISHGFEEVLPCSSTYVCEFNTRDSRGSESGGYFPSPLPHDSTGGVLKGLAGRGPEA